MKHYIADNLKHHMQLQQLSAKELARRAQLKPSFVYDVLKGRSANPSTVKLASIAHAMSLPLSALVEPQSASIAAPALKISHTAAFDGWHTPTALMQTDLGFARQCPYALSQRWVSQQLGCAPDMLRWYQAQDDTMSPTLLPGDVVLIDTAQCVPHPAGLYLIREREEVRVRRIESFYTTQHHYLRIIADNPCYSSYEKEASTIDMLGRIVWMARMMATPQWHPGIHARKQ